MATLVAFTLAVIPNSFARVSGDRKVKLWNFEGEVLQSFEHGDFVHNRMSNPANPALATAADDGIVE